MEPIRICKKCGKALPETKEYFYTQFNKKMQKEYFKGSCKECCKKQSAEWHHKNPEKLKIIERNRWIRIKNDEEYKEKRRECCRRYYYSEKGQEAVRKYREEHADEQKAKALARYYADKDRAREQKKRWISENPEMYREEKRRYREKHKDELAQKKHDHYERNKEHYREYSRTYRHLKAEEEREHCRRRRSSISSMPKHLTEEQWGAAKQAFSNRCAYCGRERSLEQEHFIPLSKGGWYTADNIIPACKSCNCSKRDRDFDEWYTKQTFFSEDRRRHILNYLGKEIAV